jgi:hypothetical protein
VLSDELLFCPEVTGADNVPTFWLLFVDILSAARRMNNYPSDSIHGNSFTCGVQGMTEVTPMLRNWLGTLTDKMLILINAGEKRALGCMSFVLHKHHTMPA